MKRLRFLVVSLAILGSIGCASSKPNQRVEPITDAERAGGGGDGDRMRTVTDPNSTDSTVQPSGTGPVRPNQE